MVAGVYNGLIQYEEVGGDMVQRIRLMGMYDVFESLDRFCDGDMSRFNPALFYIIHTYSFESKYHVLGVEWLDIKKKVLAQVGGEELKKISITRTINEMPVYSTLYDELLYMTDPQIVLTIDKYLSYQGNRNFKHLIMLKDLYEQMVRGALEPIRKSTGEVDFDQKNKNRGYAASILNEITEWEQKVTDQTSQLIKEGVKELNKRKTSQTRSLRMEDNLTNE